MRAQTIFIIILSHHVDIFFFTEYDMLRHNWDTLSHNYDSIFLKLHISIF